jgi:hypothetical protein
MRSEQKAQVTLHLPVDVKLATQRKAADERRSFNNQVEKTLADDLQRTGYLPMHGGTAGEVV